VVRPIHAKAMPVILAQGAGAGGRPITQANKQRFADALFMIYWASGRLLGLNPQVDLGPEDPDLAG
jgi:hypothetical protein